jgi:D-amino-acid dehydrogenase
LEPAVRADSILGGVFFPNEAHVEPLATVRHLIDLASENGAIVQSNTEVLDFVGDNGIVRSVLTNRGEISAGKIVLAAGSWSGKLGAKLSIKIPMLGGKGYAVIVPPPSKAPSVPIMLVDRKVAITPRATSLRIAGTLELVDLDESVTMSRVHTMMCGARTILDVPANPRITEIWRGLRPCTPDGVPVISLAPRFSNLYIAAGHQMLGLQTATGTGMLVADLVTGSTPCVDPEPFRAGRFN